MASTAWKQAKRWPGWALLAVVVIAVFAIGLGRSSKPTEDDRVDAIAKKLACPICDGESVFESRNTASTNIRNEIRAQVQDGQLSNDQIITYFVQRDSRLLLVPRATGIDSLVWALPVFAGVCALAGLAFAFRRWSRAADTVPTPEDRELVAAARLIDEP
jgi:cytochrome c-type biogenesis protein CcmH